MRKMQARKRRSEAGFSIVELIVALSIFSLVVGVLYSGFWTSARLLTSGDDNIKVIEQKLMLQRLVVKWLENAVVSTDERSIRNLSFTGSERQVDFYTTQTHFTQTPVVYRIRFRIIEEEIDNKRAPKLEITQRIQRPSFFKRGSTANVQRTTVDLDPRSGGFAYLVKPASNRSAARWDNEWTEGRRLPFAVRLKIGDDDFIIAAPLSKIDGECLSRRGIEGLAGRFCRAES